MDNPSIKFDAVIHRGTSSTVTKGVIEGISDHKLFIIKKELNTQQPKTWDLARLQHEFDYLKILQGNGVPELYEISAKLEEEYGLAGRHYILLAFAGDSLTQLIRHYKTNAEHTQQPYRIPLSVFFTIARQIMESLMAIHHHNIIHKDINPNNILYDDKQQRISMIDFGLSTRISREQPMQVDLKQLQGTLPYLAPEQSGRINRPVDYRSDYYSLGLTYYELLTGGSPYHVNEIHDPMAWVHAHITQQPTPPEHKNPDVPPTLRNIILKLLHKDAEQRYQNGHALLCDLHACQAQVLAVQQTSANLSTLPTLPLSGADIPAHLTLPQRLYGREQEIKTLMAAFDNICTGATELLLVTGYSGVGKSALVQEVKQRLGRHQGFFIAGKFEQLQRNTPYSGLVQAFQSLIRQIHLCGSEQTITQWRQRIQTALGANGRLLTDLVPDLTQFIGVQPQVPQLRPEETRNRFAFTLKAFFGAICAKEHPLILFLDDLQWSDASTLDLIKELIVNKEIGSLLLIGAYRNNAVDAIHPLTVTLQQIAEKQPVKPYDTLDLQPLCPETVQQILQDTFHQPRPQTHMLGELMYLKTEGNPFFMYALLSILYHDELINFNDKTGQWSWNLDRIKQADISSNVVEFMIRRIQTQPQDTQTALLYAACIGNRFDLHTLALICEQATDLTARQLQPALEEEIIIPLSAFYRFAGNKKTQSDQIIYRFAHDRIQQAAYALIEQQQKGPIHYRLAQLLDQRWDAQTKADNIFTLVEHFNLGHEPLHSHAEKLQLARLNLKAGKKAKNSTAYQSALTYLKKADDLLSEDAWTSAYDLRLAVSNQLIETYFFCADHQQVAHHFTQITTQTSDEIDQFIAYKTRIASYFAQNLLGQAIESGLYFLRLLGLHLPRQPNRLNLLVGVLRIKLALQQWDNASLLSLPEMQDKIQLASIEIMSSIARAAYNETPNLVPLGIFHMLRISLRFGNTGLSCFVYAACGLVFCSALQDYQRGNQLGKLAIQLLDSRNENIHRCNTIFVYYAFIYHWQHALKASISPLQKNYFTGKASGDIEYASVSLLNSAYVQYFSGSRLCTVKQCLNTHNAAMKNMGQRTDYNVYQLLHQMIDNHIDESSEPAVLSGAICNESSILNNIIASKDRNCLAIFYMIKVMLCFIFDATQQGKRQYINAEKYIESLAGLYHIPPYLFFSSLSLLALSENGEKTINQRRIVTIIKNNQKKLKKMAEHAPMNCLHKWRLVEAERCRSKQQTDQAEQLYNQAITGARENGFIQDEAIGNELAAKFYLDQGLSEVGLFFLTQARDCYHRWGAMAKVKHMQKRHPQLTHAPLPTTDYAQNQNAPTLMTTNSMLLDFNSVQKAAQSIASEFQLQRLLAKLIHIMLENAGAQKCILLLTTHTNKPSKPELEMVAWCDITQDKQIDQNRIPLSQAVADWRIPACLIHAIRHQQQPIVIADARQAPECQNDLYFNQHNVHSVLCLPLLKQNRLIGLLYLENNLTTNAFTSERQKVLQTLATQATISLENASLYANLEQTNEKLKEQLKIQKERDLIKETFGYYVPKEVSENLINGKLNLGGENRVLSVLFSDIRGFSRFSETMSPENLLHFLKNYFDEMTDIIIQQRGTLLEYIGDEILSLFGAPIETDQHASDACHAAIKMQRRLQTLRVEHPEQPIFAGIGINTGEMLVGNIGSSHRFRYGVIGDNVNVGSRLESATKQYGVDIILSEETVLLAKDTIRVRELDFIVLRGKKLPTRIYQLIGLIDDVQDDNSVQLLDCYHAGLKAYQAGDFRTAQKAFETCLKLDAQDQPSRLLLDKCHDLRRNPPQEE